MLRNRDQEDFWLLLYINWSHVPCIIVKSFAFPPVINWSHKWSFHTEGVSRGKKRRKYDSPWLSAHFQHSWHASCCLFPSDERDTFANDTTHVCLNPITLTRFEKDLAYTYEDPKEISDNLSSSLGLRCLTHCVVLVLCVPGIKQCIIWILLLPVSVCFERATWVQ